MYIETEQSGKYDDPPLPNPDYVASNHYELWQTLTCPASCNKEKSNWYLKILKYCGKIKKKQKEK